MIVSEAKQFLNWNGSSVKSSPFELRCETAYQQWREQKLIDYPQSIDALTIEITNLALLANSELLAIKSLCQKCNMVIYRNKSTVADKELIKIFSRQLGLIHLDKNICADDDGISVLQTSSNVTHKEYIPYSNKSINWHTDGYYNSINNKINSMLLHCVTPAKQGGANALCDHEMVYLNLRDADPEFIEALMHPNTMTIPANISNGVEIRPVQSGPVFSIDSISGDLHMRYTARTRSVYWRKDRKLKKALSFLEELLNNSSPIVFHHRLEAGEGIVCNNVLHNRTAFEDDSNDNQIRTVYRIRSYDRITDSRIVDNCERLRGKNALFK